MSRDLDGPGTHVAAEGLSALEAADRATFAPDTALPLIWARDFTLEAAAEMLVEGLLPRVGCTLAYGESGCGKTFFTTDLAMHIATSRKWFGRSVEPGLVVYVAGEGASGIRKRVLAWGTHHGITPADDVPMAVIPTSLDLCRPADHRRGEESDADALISTIAAAVKSGGRIRAIFFDTLSRMFGGGNENAPDDMGAFVGTMAKICQHFDCHIFIVHHSGKSADKGARGHTILRAAVDTEIYVKRDPDTKAITAKVTKQREIETEGGFLFRLKVVDLGSVKDSDTIITSCVVEGLDEAPPKAGTPEQQIALNVLYEFIAAALKRIQAATNGDASKVGFPPSIAKKDLRAECIAADLFKRPTKDGRRKAFDRAFDELADDPAVAVHEMALQREGSVNRLLLHCRA